MRRMESELFSLGVDAASVTLVESAIEFGGETFEPTPTLAYVEFRLCHSLPQLNAKKRGLTAATMANSFASAKGQLVDREHRLAKFSPILHDEIIGYMAAVDFPPKEEAMEQSAAGTMVPLRALASLFRDAQDVEGVVEEIQSGTGNWGVSMELARNILTDAFLYEGKLIPRFDASGAMESCIEHETVNDFEGKPLALILGGEDGEVFFTGAGLTQFRADGEAVIERVAASLKAPPGDAARDNKSKVFILGWGRDAASKPDKEKKTEPPPPAAEAETGAITINNSEESAVNTPSWGDVDKTALKTKLEDATDSVIKEAFARVEDTEKKSTWSFPHHVVKGESLVLHEGGVKAAWSAAMGGRSGKKAEESVITHLERHRKTLGMEEEEGAYQQLAVIGQTELADGHVHDMLEDLTVLPVVVSQPLTLDVDGRPIIEYPVHEHWAEVTTIGGGRVRGLTSVHWDYGEIDDEPNEHRHIFDIDAMAAPTPVETKEVEMRGELVEKLLALFGDVAVAVKGKTEIEREIVELSSELKTEVKDEDAAKQFQAKIDAGEIVTKEAHDAAVAQAGADALAAHKERTDKETARIDEATKAGIDLDAVVGKTAEGQERKVRDIVLGFPLDEAGDQQFQDMLATCTAATAKEDPKKTKDPDREIANMTPKGVVVPFGSDGGHIGEMAGEEAALIA